MFHNISTENTLKKLGVNKNIGLTSEQVVISRKKYGKNEVTPRKQKSLIKRIIDALLEPMMIILLIAAMITLGVNLGKAISGVDGNFFECLGIFIAIFISVSLTVIMEGRSKRAFEMLSKMSDTSLVKVLRDGEFTVVDKSELVVGDIMQIEAGDKISADARLISTNYLKIDESTLTGESNTVNKNEKKILNTSVTLAERENCVYSGTYVASGDGLCVVTAVGDNAEIGKIASHLTTQENISAPLEQKLAKLGKVISIIGAISAGFVFVLSFIRLLVLDKVSFFSVQDIFIESIVLIVAAVPEGLPSTVAISLSLNVIKLAKSNALIKKLVATETIGAVSVICTDKTGTLTENKMTVSALFISGAKLSQNQFSNEFINLNCAINSTAEILKGKEQGSKTETALLLALKNSKISYSKLRKQYKVLSKIPFSSEKKFMQTEISHPLGNLILTKGAPEYVLKNAKLSEEKRRLIEREIEMHQRESKRVLAFSHTLNGVTVFDGYCVLEDNLRSDVEKSVKACVLAGVKVKILTGDNLNTAKSIANKLHIGDGYGKTVSGDEIENMTDNELLKIIDDISVVARSTPSVKLKIVKALQKKGEVVAVTGDGVNDAPAIKSADVGISMGDGADVTKESADLILLDNGFSTILQAIKFGRNIYRNFQRFITFQLTVNLSSMCIIIAFLILGMESPFSSTCLLWLNVIMDGPLALSLGLESATDDVLSQKPVSRNDSILSAKTFLQIAIRGGVIAFIVTAQEIFNFLGCSLTQKHTVTFATFVIFQLFNAINCREIHAKSSLKGLFTNKLLVVCSVLTFILQIIITERFTGFFDTVPLNLVLWCKITLLGSLIVAFSEAYKLCYRKLSKKFSKQNS